MRPQCRRGVEYVVSGSGSRLSTKVRPPIKDPINYNIIPAEIRHSGGVEYIISGSASRLEATKARLPIGG